MALVDPIGPGPLPLYEPGYPGQVGQARLASGVSSTTLSDRAGYFREALQQDPAFEVFHFVPLYFVQAGRTEVFSALSLLAETEEGIPRSPSARTAFGVAAVGSILTTSSQRRVLGEFVQALEDEWDSFFGGWLRERAGELDQTLGSIQRAWSQDFANALKPFLEGVGMTGGLVAVVPAIGTEGRIFAGTPDDPGDNVLVVSAPSGPDRGSEAVFSILRELSFPLARRAIDRAGSSTGTRSQDENVAARAAVRTGALVLEDLLHEALTHYQQYFLFRAGQSAPAGAALRAAFEAAYPLSGDLERALEEEVISTMTDGGEG
jgi:hypothetical protein